MPNQSRKGTRRVTGGPCFAHLRMEGVEEVPQERRPETAEKLQLLDGTGNNSTLHQDDADIGGMYLHTAHGSVLCAYV